MPSFSSLKVYPVDLERDWDSLFKTFWESWSVPRQAAMVATFPNIGQGGPKEIESFEAKKAQYLTAAKTSPGQIWLKLVDEGKSSSPIVGGICVTHWKDWQQTRHMPDKAHEGFEPGSQLQKISEQFYGQLHDWHGEIMKPREHIFGQAMWTLPEYRNHHGVSLLVEEIRKIVDERDVEAYAEGVSLSKGLLCRIGYEVISTVNFKMNVENPTKESQELIDEFLSEPLYLMWRPRKSDQNRSASRPPSVRGQKDSKL